MPTALKGTWWRRVRQAPSGTFNAACNAGNWWVLVGTGNGIDSIIYIVDKILVQDATPFFNQRTPGGNQELNDVDYLGDEDIVFAVGDTGVLEQSTNQGVSWSASFLPSPYNAEGVVCRNADVNSNVIVVGDNTIWGRDSTKVFTTRRVNMGDRWKSVAWRPGVGWVVVGDSGAVTHSPTGINGTFVAPFSITAQNLKSVKANESYFMACGSFGNVWRSVTGASGTWTQLDLGSTGVFFVCCPLDYIGSKWVAANYDGEFWYTDDNGDNWSKGDFVLQEAPKGGAAIVENALLMGEAQEVYVSYTDNQTDYVAPEPNIDLEPGVAFGANSDMAGDAVKRFVTQFRSGRG